MTDAILEITDGTTRIDLINPSSGFHLTSWIPQITDYKGGGVFQNPPLADWRQLRAAKWDTAQENFGLTVNGQNPNGVAYMLQQLRQLLKKANDYWTTDWQNDPVWVVAKAKCETNTRYCLIVKGRLGNDQNYYQQPFTGRKSTMRDLPLIIERRAWLDNIPGIGNATPISNLQTFDGVTFGTVNSAGVRQSVTAQEALYISNRRADQNFTHIFNFDASGTSFSANLLDTIPMTLFPAGATTGDIVYFGIQSSLTDAGPVFAPIIFDLSVRAQASYTIIWEIWTGSWDAVDTTGQQDQFETVGIGSVNWQPVAGQTTTTINGVAGYWIRARLSGTLTARPVQQNRNPYIANLPYWEVQAGDIAGDITALANVKALGGAANDESLDVEIFLYSMLFGLRSVSRGENFTAYLNFSSENNPVGITIDDVSIGFTANEYAAAGEIISSAIAGPGTDLTRAIIQFDETLLPEYYGRFRAFLRARLSAGAVGDISLRLKLANLFTNEIFLTEYITLPTSTLPQIPAIDFGEIVIPSAKAKPTESFNDFEIFVDANVDSPGGTIQLYDLILIPSDELIVMASGNPMGAGGPVEYIDIDSVNFPKFSIRANSKWKINDYISHSWQTIASDSLTAQANTRQRFWNIFNTNQDASNIAINASIQMQDVQRYLSLRGDQ